MDRLSYEVCKPFYDALGLEFEEYNPAQFAVVSSKDRFPLVVGGERGGKSFATAAVFVPHIELLPQIRPARFLNSDGTIKFNPKDKKPMVPDFVLFGPSYAEPRVEFSYIEDWLRDLDDVQFVSKPQDGPWRLLTKQGVVLSTWSTDNPGTIRGIDLEAAAAVECGNMEWDAIERIQGRIGAKRGFCVYSGTMENAKRWYVNWSIEGERENKFRIKTYKIPSWSNTKEFPGGEMDDEIQRWKQFYGPDSYTWFTRVCATPVPPRDRVLGEFTDRHIRKVKIPRKPDGSYDARIEICIDPGYLPSAYAVLWVASWDTPEGRFWYVFDELYQQMTNNEQVIDWIKNHKFYKYLGPTDMTIDVSAKRHADGNEPAIEKYKKLTKLKSPYFKYWHENALIERLRTTAHQNMIAVHPNCEGFIAELGLGTEVFQDMHPWKYHAAKDGTILNDKPIDEWNHSAKALGYLLLRHLNIVERMGDSPKPLSRFRRGRSGNNRFYKRKEVHA